jgi:predicted dehydrogenase
VHPFLPQLGHTLVWETAAGGTRTEDLGKTPTFDYQLRAFAEHLRGGMPMPTGADNAIATMTLIDAIYRAAGLPRRGTRSPG